MDPPWGSQISKIGEKYALNINLILLPNDSTNMKMEYMKNRPVE
jgi:hypothetical protein